MLKMVGKKELKQQEKWDLAKGSWCGHAKDERRKFSVE